MKLNIGGHNYVINEVPETVREDGKLLLGVHNVKDCTINIDKEMKHTRKVETLLHEVIHVILPIQGVTMMREPLMHWLMACYSLVSVNSCGKK